MRSARRAQRVALAGRCEDQAGSYLLYLDKDGVEMTDKWNETGEAAVAQATFEFEVELLEWQAP